MAAQTSKRTLLPVEHPDLASIRMRMMIISPRIHVCCYYCARRPKCTTGLNGDNSRYACIDFYPLAVHLNDPFT